MSEGQKPRFLQRVIGWVGGVCALLLGLAAFAPFAAAAGITLQQAILWLRTGAWVSRPTSTYVSLPPDFLQNWLGARAIVDWFIEGSIQGTLILCGILGLFLFAKFLKAIEPDGPSPSRRDY
jgi:hypothetical protein